MLVAPSGTTWIAAIDKFSGLLTIYYPQSFTFYVFQFEKRLNKLVVL